MTYATKYLSEASQILQQLDTNEIEKMVRLLVDTRARSGRLFLLGVGGGAGHASHAVCDFRKIAGIEAYAPSDNVTELTARVNDEGWDTTYAAWLAGSHLQTDDMILVFSVGGGDLERNISPNLVRALEYVRQVGARIIGIVGRDGGYTARVADACVIVPTVNRHNITAHTESFQALIWHLLVSHPEMQTAPMKWESVQ
jgi:D-sedoheptulose 7-phosphate isomerase